MASEDRSVPGPDPTDHGRSNATRLSALSSGFAPRGTCGGYVGQAQAHLRPAVDPLNRRRPPRRRGPPNHPREGESQPTPNSNTHARLRSAQMARTKKCLTSALADVKLIQAQQSEGLSLPDDSHCLISLTPYTSRSAERIARAQIIHRL